MTASFVQRDDVPSEVKELVPFIEARRGAARGSIFGYGPEDLPMFDRRGEVLRCPACGRIYFHEHEREYMESGNPYVAPDPPEDTYSYQWLDPEQLFRSEWFVTLRIDHDGRFAGDRRVFWVLDQKFFRLHAFARVELAGATQTLVLPDEEPPIVVDLPTMSRVIAADPPDLREREVEYARFVDGVTSEYRYQFMQIDSFDDIPWREDLTDAARAQIEELRSASPVEPMRVNRTPDAVVIQRWIVAHQKLICRILTVRPTGEVTREDAIVGENIPTHLGTRWSYNFKRNRTEPVG